MKIEITEKRLITAEVVHHLKIKLNKKFYFIIVTILMTQDGENPILTIKRGSSYFDCGLKLKKDEKKLIKRTIELMF